MGEFKSRFKILRSKIDDCEIKTKEIFERSKTVELEDEAVRDFVNGHRNIATPQAAIPSPRSIERALVIHEEHLSHILSGLKTEEIRSKGCSSGWTALSCGGLIYGVTEIIEVIEEIDALQYLLSWESWRRHRIGCQASGLPPSAASLKDKIAEFLSELSVNSRGHHYLKYWRNGSARVYRWRLGPVYRTDPCPRIARAYTRTWIKLDLPAAELICESLQRAGPSAPALSEPSARADGGVGGGGGLLASRFFKARGAADAPAAKGDPLVPCVPTAASLGGGSPEWKRGPPSDGERLPQLGSTALTRGAGRPVGLRAPQSPSGGGRRRGSSWSSSSDSSDGGPADSDSERVWLSAFVGHGCGGAPHKRPRMCAL